MLEDLDLFFKEPYTSNIPGLFNNGDKDIGAINKELTDTIPNRAQNDFRNNSADEKYRSPQTAPKANSPLD